MNLKLSIEKDRYTHKGPNNHHFSKRCFQCFPAARIVGSTAFSRFKCSEKLQSGETSKKMQDSRWRKAIKRGALVPSKKNCSNLPPNVQHLCNDRNIKNYTFLDTCKHIQLTIIYIMVVSQCIRITYDSHVFLFAVQNEVLRVAPLGAQQILMPTFQQGLSFPPTPCWDEINSGGFQSTKFIEIYGGSTKVGRYLCLATGKADQGSGHFCHDVRALGLGSKSYSAYVEHLYSAQFSRDRTLTWWKYPSHQSVWTTNNSKPFACVQVNCWNIQRLQRFSGWRTWHTVLKRLTILDF